jgi:hypothetical protein
MIINEECAPQFSLKRRYDGRIVGQFRSIIEGDAHNRRHRVEQAAAPARIKWRIGSESLWQQFLEVLHLPQLPTVFCRFHYVFWASAGR